MEVKGVVSRGLLRSIRFPCAVERFNKQMQ